MASVMTEPQVTRLGPGVYRVDAERRSDIVYVARTASGVWAFLNGQIFRGSDPADASPRSRRHAATGGVAQAIAAPMPATVIKVLVAPGDSVKKGDTVLVLEAMKMELPLRAAGDAQVAAVRCREGDLVQPDTVLVEFA
jgi:biotin carboxyl carrier protein